MSDVRRTLLFLVKDDQILLAMKKRGFGEGNWNGVGGKLDPGESVEEALIRECQEEIGVTPTSYRQVAELDFYGGSVAEPWQMYVYAYLCYSWQGTPTESEEMAPQWFNQSAIPYQQMWKDDIYWLPQVLHNKLLKGHFTFDEQNNIASHKVAIVESLDR